MSGKITIVYYGWMPYHTLKRNSLGMNFWQTNKIRLRAIEPSDAATFNQWNMDSERARMLDFLWPPSTLSFNQSWAEETSRRKMDNDCFHWLIETLDGIPVGSISTHDCSPHNGTFSYGIDVAEEHRGKGYATEAIKLVTRYYFEERRYQKVNVQIHDDNPASIRLHEKIGFQLEGTLRRMVFTRGQFHDVLLYGITKEEFCNLQGSNA
jgi:RimJ/RimL family protein N-acetyltransferase